MIGNCKHPTCELLYHARGKVKLEGVYKARIGKRQGMSIWIVERDVVVRHLYPEFIMGGNDQRYRFNPLNEIWVDSNIGVEELEYTIEHELIERKLMLEKGWSYNRAHSEGGLAKEKRMRDADLRRLVRKKNSVKQLAPREGTGSASGRLVDPVCLSEMYRQYVGTKGGVETWIVDGPKVRHFLNPDYCYASYDLKSPFIPENEIWLDSAMSVSEMYFALNRARRERELLLGGTRFSKAYDTAMSEEFDERWRQAALVARHEGRLPPVDLGVRSKGVKGK